MALKKDGAHFVLCPKQGNKIGKGMYFIIFSPKQGQGVKPSAAHLYPQGKGNGGGGGGGHV